MAELTVEKATCENCGVCIRENTQFCYNCGNSFCETVPVTNGSEPVAISDDANTAPNDLAAKLKMEDAVSADALALAAEQRKNARVIAKKQIVWEETDSGPGAVFFIASLVIFVIVAAVVFITVYWK